MHHTMAGGFRPHPEEWQSSLMANATTEAAFEHRSRQLAWMMGGPDKCKACHAPIGMGDGTDGYPRRPLQRLLLGGNALGRNAGGRVGRERRIFRRNRSRGAICYHGGNDGTSITPVRPVTKQVRNGRSAMDDGHDGEQEESRVGPSDDGRDDASDDGADDIRGHGQGHAPDDGKDEARADREHDGGDRHQLFLPADANCFCRSASFPSFLCGFW